MDAVGGGPYSNTHSYKQTTFDIIAWLTPAVNAVCVLSNVHGGAASNVHATCVE